MTKIESVLDLIRYVVDTKQEDEFVISEELFTLLERDFFRDGDGADFNSARKKLKGDWFKYCGANFYTNVEDALKPL